MFEKNKPAILFLIKFVVVYASMSALYSYYLDSFAAPAVDGFTQEVAHESSHLCNVVGFDSYLTENTDEASVPFWLDGEYRIKIVEGCNGLSVMILFVAFIIAFGGKLIHKLWFVPLGLLLIHVSNIIRISFLAYVYVYHYDYAQMTHDYVFPSIIYGMVFLLWVVWVNYFAVAEKKPQ